MIVEKDKSPQKSIPSRGEEEISDKSAKPKGADMIVEKDKSPQKSTTSRGEEEKTFKKRGPRVRGGLGSPHHLESSSGST